MKSLNLIFVIAVCLMVISHASATYYIVKSFENFGKKSKEGAEGQLTADGQKRVQCFAGLVGNKINPIDHIYYKADGTDKNGNIKVNSRKYTADALSQQLGGIPADSITKDDLGNLIERTQQDGSQNALFVWSDQDKTKEVAIALGAANYPADFNKDNYGGIWAIEGSQLTEMTMDCEGLSNINASSGSPANLRLSIMSLAVAVMASLYFFF